MDCAIATPGHRGLESHLSWPLHAPLFLASGSEKGEVAWFQYRKVRRLCL